MDTSHLDVAGASCTINGKSGKGDKKPGGGGLDVRISDAASVGLLPIR